MPLENLVSVTKPSPISKSAWTAAALKLNVALLSPSGLEVEKVDLDPADKVFLLPWRGSSVGRASFKRPLIGSTRLTWVQIPDGTSGGRKTHSLKIDLAKYSE